MKQLRPQSFKEGDWAFDVRLFEWIRFPKKEEPPFDGREKHEYSHPTLYSVENAKMIFDAEPPVDVPEVVWVNCYNNTPDIFAHLTADKANEMGSMCDGTESKNRIGCKAWKYVRVEE